MNQLLFPVMPESGWNDFQAACHLGVVCHYKDSPIEFHELPYWPNPAVLKRLQGGKRPKAPECGVIKHDVCSIGLLGLKGFYT